jgi:hypothetical protein
MMDDNSRERLEKYYELIMGGQSEQQKKTVDYIYGRMTDNARREAEEVLAKKDPRYAQMKRISAYAAKINEIMASKEQKEEADRLFKAYEGFDFDKFQREEINGNIFEFEKGFPIEQYRDQLSEIGNHEKDNTYMVDLDPEGKLEVY